MRALREEVWVWIVSVIGDLYPKEYKNIREIIIRLEKVAREIYFVSLLLLL